MYNWYLWDDDGFTDCEYPHPQEEYCTDCCPFQGELQRGTEECDSCYHYDLCEEAESVLGKGEKEEMDLGSCCCCEGTEAVRNIGMLPKKAPVPGTGWGCLICCLENDGAVYVCCDKCLEEKRPPKFACFGYPKDGKRIRIEELQGVHEHNMDLHLEEEKNSGEETNEEKF